MAASWWLKYAGLTGEPQAVHCSRCGGEIPSRSELMVIPWLGFALEPVCLNCYAQQEKRVGYQLFTPSIPINHGVGNWRVLTAPAFLLLWLGLLRAKAGGEHWPYISPVLRWIFFPFFFLSLIFGPLVRLRAYWNYERHLLTRGLRRGQAPRSPPRG
jgi:hypothetical protein